MQPDVATAQLVESNVPGELLDAELPAGRLYNGSMLDEATERFLANIRAALTEQEPEQVCSARLPGIPSVSRVRKVRAEDRAVLALLATRDPASKPCDLSLGAQT
ncbi:hypothetical protein ACOZFM_15830 [Streptomyces arboris]|uniref:hypothetical protein n=1 Tax=Streptomyces TaxID=1883 RepID=UPI0029BFF224|nr:hypothetical protein [Streptomyces sp. ME02-6991-2A]